MTTPLAPCPGCSRHVRASDAACPFCAAALDRPASGAAQATRVAVALAAALAASASLAACYGGPPHPHNYPGPRTNAAPDSGAVLDPQKP
ncbi:MAG: hypothetical protein JWM10_1182 [Myxococcaceae bacterium]|nr:hypothetical protein [Myxococcaceae bacterium]